MNQSQLMFAPRWIVRTRDVLLPARHYSYDVAFECFLARHQHEMVFEVFEPVEIQTGLALEIKPGQILRWIPKKSLIKKRLLIVSGHAQPGYRGQLTLILVNFGQTAVRLDPGESHWSFIIEKATPSMLYQLKQLPPRKPQSTREDVPAVGWF